MTIAGQEIKWKRVPLIAQVALLHQCDEVKAKLLAYVTSNEQADLDALAEEWKKWAEGACEGSVPSVDFFSTQEVISIVQGFMMTASTPL